MTDDAILTDLIDWVDAGVPGAAQIPATLALSMIPAPSGHYPGARIML